MQSVVPKREKKTRFSPYKSAKSCLSQMVLFYHIGTLENKLTCSLVSFNCIHLKSLNTCTMVCWYKACAFTSSYDVFSSDWFQLVIHIHDDAEFASFREVHVRVKTCIRFSQNMEENSRTVKTNWNTQAFLKGNNGEYILFWRPFENFSSEMSERKPFESCGSEHVLSYSTRRVVSKCLNKFQARCLLFLVKAWKHENLPRKWFPEFVAHGRKIRMFLDAGKVVSFSSDNGQEAVVCETLSDKSRKDRITSLKIYP